MRRYAVAIGTEEERALFIIINALMVHWMDCMETRGYQLLTMDKIMLSTTTQQLCLRWSDPNYCKIAVAYASWSIALILQ